MNTYHLKIAAKHGLHVSHVRDHWKAAKKQVRKQRIVPGSPVFWHMVYTMHEVKVKEHAERVIAEKQEAEATAHIIEEHKNQSDAA